MIVFENFQSPLGLGSVIVVCWALSERTRMLLTDALCGFANVGSVGITVTGLSVPAPERRAEVMGNVWKAMAAGVLANLMSAAGGGHAAAGGVPLTLAPGRFEA